MDQDKYYRGVLSRCESAETQVADVQTRLSSYLEAVNGTGQAVVQLADALAKLFAETPLAEVATRYRERADLLGDVASRTTSQLSQDVSSVLHKYTHLIPGTKSAVEAHQRSWNHFDKTRETLDHMRPGEGERVRRRAETRLEEAATAFAQNDARLAKAVQEIGEQKVQMLGSSLLNLFQTQASLFSQSLDAISGLAKFRQVGDILGNDKVNVVRDATAKWLAASQANAELRKGCLNSNDIQLILLTSQGYELPETVKNGLNQKIDRLLQDYKIALEKAPSKQVDLCGGFSLNPKGIEAALKDCCSELEARGASGYKEETTNDEMMSQIQRDTSRVEYRIGNRWFDTVPSAKAAENSKAKIKAIVDLANGLISNAVPQSALETFAVRVLNETCSTVANCASRTAVQLAYGQANLILVRPSTDRSDQSPTVITSVASAIHIEVSSTWWLVEDSVTLSPVRPDLDPNFKLGNIEATYKRSFSVSDFLASKPAALPQISVHWRPLVVSPPAKSPTGTSSFRKSFSKMTHRLSWLTSHGSSGSERRHSSGEKISVSGGGGAGGSGGSGGASTTKKASFTSYLPVDDAPTSPVEATKQASEANDASPRVSSSAPATPERTSTAGVVLRRPRKGVANTDRGGGGEKDNVVVTEKATDERGPATSTSPEPNVVSEKKESSVTRSIDDVSATTTTTTTTTTASNDGDVHLATADELQSVIDFLSGYSITSEAPASFGGQPGPAGGAYGGWSSSSYDYESDLSGVEVGYASSHSGSFGWSRASSSRSAAMTSSFGGGDGGRGSSSSSSSRGTNRNRCGSAGRKSALFDDDGITPYGHNVIYEVSTPSSGGSPKDSGSHGGYAHGFVMAQQGIIAPMNFLQPEAYSPLPSRQRSMSPRRGQKSEPGSRSSSSWPRSKGSPWLNMDEFQDGSSTYPSNERNRSNRTAAKPIGNFKDSLQPGSAILDGSGVVSPSSRSTPSPSSRSSPAPAPSNQRLHELQSQQIDWEQSWNMQQQELKRTTYS